MKPDENKYNNNDNTIRDNNIASPSASCGSDNNIFSPQKRVLGALGLQSLMRSPESHEMEHDHSEGSHHSPRRASMPGIPTGIKRSSEADNGNNRDDQSVRSSRSSRSRRASMNGRIPTNSVLGPADGYGADDDEESVFSSRSRCRQSSRTATSSVPVHLYGNSTDNREDDVSGDDHDVESISASARSRRGKSSRSNGNDLLANSGNRRASYSGVLSSNDNEGHHPIPSHSRRSGSRRASYTGSLARRDEDDCLSVSTHSKRSESRRASMSGPPPMLGADDDEDDSYGENMRDHMHFSKGICMGSASDLVGHHVDGVGSGAVSPSVGRRGTVSKRGIISGQHPQGRARVAPESRNVQRFDTADSIDTGRRSPPRGSVAAHHLQGRSRAAPESRNVQRFDTANSIDVEVSKRSPTRRGGKRISAPSQIQMSPERRSVQRVDTDKMELNNTVGAPLAAKNSPVRRGRKRGSAPPENRGVQRLVTTDSLDLAGEGGENLGGTQPERRAGKKTAMPPERRQVQRFETTDSIDLRHRSEPSLPPRGSQRFETAEDGDEDFGSRRQEEASRLSRETIQLDHDENVQQPRNDGMVDNIRRLPGINPQVVARLSYNATSSDSDERESDYAGHNAAHAYGYNPYISGGKMTVTRRGSNHSQASSRSRASHASRASRRRSRKEKEEKPGSQLQTNKAHRGAAMTTMSKDSESEDEWDAEQAASYSYGANGAVDIDQMSASEKTHSTLGTMKTTKRSKRRNSCLSPRQQQGSLLDDGPKLSDQELQSENESFAIPTSLTTPRVNHQVNSASQALSCLTAEELMTDDDLLPPESDPHDSEELLPPRMNEHDSHDGLQKPTGRLGAEKNPANEKIVPGGGHQKESWSRAQPFTTPYSAPTEDNLKDQLVSERDSDKILTRNHVEGGLAIVSTHVNVRCVDRQMESSISSESHSESEESFGASLYTESRIYQEIDKYKQKPRRRQSMESTWIDMTSYTDKKSSNVSNFKPASGCTNASDFIVRCFTARLRVGFTVVKHNRSRWSKSQTRILFLEPNGKCLTWKPAEGEGDKGKRPILDLTKCIEVRHAMSPDPATRRRLGTAVLRKKCKEGMAVKSFSLIFAKRTLDITTYTNDQCKVLMEGFSALCFRLQLERLPDEEPSERGKPGIADEDWASTVYGESSISAPQSVSPSRTSILASPWGF